MKDHYIKVVEFPLRNSVVSALMKKRILAILLALLSMNACQREVQKDPAKRLEIAVIPKGTTHEFWKSAHAGAAKAAKELGVDIIWKGPLKEDDRESQIQIVEDFISRKVDGMVLSPLDDMALRLPVKNAMENDIPVVIFDSGLNSQDYISFVATDNYGAGVIAAKHMAKLIGEKARIIMLRYSEGSNSTSQREIGFVDTMKKDFPNIELVSVNQFSGVSVEGAYKASENLLAPLKKPDGSISIDGIFCSCEPTAFGMLRALRDSGLNGKVKFVGFDHAPKLIEGLEKGDIDALLVQDPVGMGYLGVKTIVEYIRGKKPEKLVDTGITVVTKENMASSEVKKLIFPDLSGIE